MDLAYCGLALEFIWSAIPLTLSFIRIQAPGRLVRVFHTASLSLHFCGPPIMELVGARPVRQSTARLNLGVRRLSRLISQWLRDFVSVNVFDLQWQKKRKQKCCSLVWERKTC